MTGLGGTPNRVPPTRSRDAGGGAQSRCASALSTAATPAADGTTTRRVEDWSVEPRRLLRDLIAALGGAVALVIVLGIVGVVRLSEQPAAPSHASAPASVVAIGSAPAGGGSSSGSPQASGGVAILPATDPQSIGSADAPVVVEVWADFQCPFCGLFTHALEPSLLRTEVLPGTARIVYRDFAFLGAESTTAAVAARCAGQQGRFWEFHDLLFASQQGENQGAFSDATMSQLANYLDLDSTRFAACVKDPALIAAVEQSRAEGQQLGIKGTPTLRIIGPKQTVRLDRMPSLPTLLTTIDRMAHGLPAPTQEPAPVPASPTASIPAASAGATPAPSAP